MNLKKRSWVSERIRELGKKKKDLAEVLGLPHTRISDIISGNRALKVTEVQPFADFMNMSIDEVISCFASNKSNLKPNYDNSQSAERQLVELYRGLSEPGKQKFQNFVEDIIKDENK